LRRALLALVVVGCSGSPRPATDSIRGAESPDVAAREVANAIVRRDIAPLAARAHPAKGVRFTPYAHVDTIADRRLSADELRAQWSRADSLVWGAYDGSGAPIRLTLREYVDKFVGDFDVVHAPRVARDAAPMGTGNTINNVRQAYPGATVIEFHSPGTDPKYGGMDWRSLWIALERVGDGWCVVGIVHGAWTI
jgi:hypothetical protein